MQKKIIDWNGTNKTEHWFLKKKSSFEWAVDSHHDTKVRRRNITLAWKRWDKREKSKIKIQESYDSYEDRYEIYWHFAQKRKNSKSTDSIPTKKQHILHSFDFQQKNHLKGHLIVIKFQKWGYGASRPFNIIDSNQKKKLIIKETLIKIAMKNLNDYLDFQSKIIQLLKRNKQTWGLYFINIIS